MSSTTLQGHLCLAFLVVVGVLMVVVGTWGRCWHGVVIGTLWVILRAVFDTCGRCWHSWVIVGTCGRCWPSWGRCWHSWGRCWHFCGRCWHSEPLLALGWSCWHCATVDTRVHCLEHLPPRYCCCQTGVHSLPAAAASPALACKMYNTRSPLFWCSNVLLFPLNLLVPITKDVFFVRIYWWRWWYVCSTPLKHDGRHP